jgi:archaellum component FlaC
MNNESAKLQAEFASTTQACEAVLSDVARIDKQADDLKKEVENLKKYMDAARQSEIPSRR